VLLGFGMCIGFPVTGIAVLICLIAYRDADGARVPFLCVGFLFVGRGELCRESLLWWKLQNLCA
jgi:hypothetical protein